MSSGTRSTKSMQSWSRFQIQKFKLSKMMNKPMMLRIMTQLLTTMLKMRIVKAHTILTECNHLMSLSNKTNLNAHMNPKISKLTRSPSGLPKIQLRNIGMILVKDILTSVSSFIT